MSKHKFIGGTVLRVAAVLWIGGAFAGNASPLQSLLDKGGDVRFPAGEYVVERTLVVSPGTHLVCAPGFRARLADGANCAILANRNPAAVQVADISIEGGVWDGNNVHQDRSKYTEAGFTPRLKYGRGFYGQLIVFSGVRGLKLKGLTVKDPQGYSIMLTDTENFTVEDIVFDCNDRTPNEDGVHINGFARHGVVRRLRGHTNDDLVALNSDEGDWRSSDCTIEDILIEDLDGEERGYTGVRLLSRNAQVRNVTIRRVRGRFQFNVVSFTHWAKNAYKPGMGHFDNVLLEDITATSCRKSGTGHGGLIWFQEGVQDVGTVRIRNLRRVESADYLNETCTIEVADRVRIRRLELENVTQDIPDDKPLVKVSPTAQCAIARATGTVLSETTAATNGDGAWPEEKGCLSAKGREKMTHTISPMFCAFRRNAPTGESGSGADAFYGFYQAGETHTVENVADPTELMRLSVLKATGGTVTRSFVDVGVAGQDFGSFVQTTKRPPCAQTAVEKDGLLYLFFRGRREDMTSIWCYRNFDTRAGKLTDGATICTLDGREFNGVTARDAYNRASGDCQTRTALANECTVKRFSDGWYYMIVCVGGDCVGLVVRSQNLKDWLSVTATPDLGKGPTMEHEIVELAPGKWFSAWRQECLGGVWTAAYDVSTRTWSVPERVPDSIAVKPCLFVRRGKAYLATNLKGSVTTPGYGTAVRATLGVFEVAADGRLKKLRTIVNPTGCHYAGTVEDGAGNLYLCHSTDERKLDVTQCRSNIGFFRFEP